VVVVGHLALTLLLMRHRHIVTSRPGTDADAIIISNVADRPATARPNASAVAGPTVTVEVSAPDVEIEPAVTVASAGSNDPFAGAALPVSAATQATVPMSDAYRQWVAEVRQSALSSSDARTVSGVSLELLCQPGGGFTDARIRLGTGDPALDTALLKSVMARQALVQRGLVDTPNWLLLPSFSLAADAKAHAPVTSPKESIAESKRPT